MSAIRRVFSSGDRLIEMGSANLALEARPPSPEKPLFAGNSGNGGGYVGPPIDLSDQVVSGIRDIKVAVGGTGQIVHPVVDRFRCLESVAGKAVFSISRKNAGLAIGAKKENSSSFVFGDISVALAVKGQSERVGRLGRIQNNL